MAANSSFTAVAETMDRSPQLGKAQMESIGRWL